MSAEVTWGVGVTRFGWDDETWRAVKPTDKQQVLRVHITLDLVTADDDMRSSITTTELSSIEIAEGDAVEIASEATWLLLRSLRGQLTPGAIRAEGIDPDRLGTPAIERVPR